MDLNSQLEIRIEANKNFVDTLKEINRYETGLFKEDYKIKKRFNIYVAKDDRLVKIIQEDNSVSEEILKKTMELLESQTNLIIEYGLYKAKYRLPHN
jgi:hypothetical protein